MKSIAVALCLSVSMAQAAVIAEATDGKVRVELHDQNAHCQDGAMLALYHQDGKTTTGCWRQVGQFIQFAWSDADIARVPASLFKKVSQG
jgi:hypothetical protein